VPRCAVKESRCGAYWRSAQAGLPAGSQGGDFRIDTDGLSQLLLIDLGPGDDQSILAAGQPTGHVLDPVDLMDAHRVSEVRVEVRAVVRQSMLTVVPRRV